MLENLKNQKSIKKSAVNMETQTISVNLSDESDVVRYSWEKGKYFITLLHGEENVDLERKDILSVFVNHNTYDLPIGIFENVRIEDRKLKADAKFDKDDEASMKIFNKLASGFLKSFSVGIDVHEMELSKEIDGVKHYNATKWSIQEASIVGVPAIPTAKVGLNKEDSSRVNSASNHILNKGVPDMEFTKEKFDALELSHSTAIKKIEDEKGVISESLKRVEEEVIELKAAKESFEKENLEKEKILGMIFKTNVSETVAKEMFGCKTEAEASLIALNAMSNQSEGNTFTGVNSQSDQNVDNSEQELKKACENMGIEIVGGNE